MKKVKKHRRKIAFIGAGSLGFTQNLITDILSFPALSDSHLALMDINAGRLKYGLKVAERIILDGKYPATVEASQDRKRTLKDADYVFITILAHGFEGFVKELEIPMKYGVNQAVGDTTGPGGVFRALRTIPIMLEIVRDVEQYSSERSLILNYTNPMHMLSWAIFDGSPVQYVGLCHGVQGTTELLARVLDVPLEEISYWVAGINHLAWVLRFEHNGKSLLDKIREACNKQNFYREEPVRCEICRHFGYFCTESSCHDSEYIPWVRKNKETLAKFLPGGFNNYGMLLQEYKSREQWEVWMKDLASGKIPVNLLRSHEYGARILNAIETNEIYRFNGNLKNTGLITNLQEGSCVEVPCHVDRNGIKPVFVGDLPPHLAAICRQNIAVHEMAVLAAKHKDPELAFQAISYDPLTASVCSLQQIRNMVWELFQAQKEYLPGYPVDKFRKIKEMKAFSGDKLVDVHSKDKKTLFRELNVIEQFYVLGPFDNLDENKNSLGLSAVLAPEKEIVLDKTYTGKDGKKIKWKLVRVEDMDNNGYVNLCLHCAKVDMAVAYAYTILEATAGTLVKLQLGSDDGIAVWLNKREIYRKEAERCAGRGQEEVTLQLKHGKNELLLKIDQKHGGWGFYANFSRNAPGVSVRLK